MPIKIANIIRGINKRIFKKKVAKNYPSISWLQTKMLKHQEEENIKSVKLGRLTFNYKYPFEILHTYGELFEEEIYRFESTNKSPLIIDCGANIGLSVLYFKSLYPAANIVAYEPDENNVMLLMKNIEGNKLDKVTIRREAVWKANEKLHFRSIASQGSQLAINSTGENTIEVNAIRLADVLEENGADMLKIDIEGAEYEVMKDCANSLDKVKNIFVEYHGKVNETVKLVEILSILNDNKYKVYIKMAADQIHHPYISKQTDGSFDVQLNIFGYR